MKSIRRIHAWLGVLFAPSILLFSLSGVFQMYGCHERDDEGGGEPAAWIVRTAQLHMKQTIQLPRRRPPRPPSAAPAPAPTTSSSDARPPGAEARPTRPTTAPLRLFFLLMSIALIASSVLGVYLAFASKRDRGLHAGLLIAGVVLPIVLMML